MASTAPVTVVAVTNKPSARKTIPTKQAATSHPCQVMGNAPNPTFLNHLDIDIFIMINISVGLVGLEPTTSLKLRPLALTPSRCTLPTHILSTQYSSHCRAKETRTPGLHVPNVARYQLRYSPAME